MQSERIDRSGFEISNAEKWHHFSALSHSGRVALGLACAVLLLGTALRVYGLADKGFWGDEIFQVRQSLRPLEALLTRGQTPEIYDDFALHFVVLHFVGELGQSEFWLRLPSVAFSVLAIAATWLVGYQLYGRTAGLIAMVLMAVAPFQIWYAQETRMYAAHTLYGALSFYFFLRLLKRPDRAAVAGLTAVNALGWYNHLFMVFPMIVEGATALVVLATDVVRRNGVRRGGAILVSLALTVGLGAPLVLGFLPYLPQQVSQADATGAAPKIDAVFIQNLFLHLSMGADWGWRVMVSAGLALGGLIWLVRRDLKQLWIPIAFVLPLVLLYLVPPEGNIAHRYLIFLQPLFLVLMAGGAWLAGRWIVEFFRARGREPHTIGWVVAATGTVFLLLMVVPPLVALYPRAKLNDWRALTTYVREEAVPNDRVMLERAPWAERAFRWYYPEARARFGSVDDLRRAEEQGTRVWYLSFGGYFDAATEAWVKEHLKPMANATWQQPGLVYAAEDGFVFPQSESSTTLYVSEW